MLGKMSDRQVAAAVGVSVETVKERRSRLRIPAVGREATPTPPELVGFPTLEEATRAHVVRALELTRGNISAAARALGLDRWSMVRQMEKLGLKEPRPSRTQRRRPPEPPTPVAAPEHDFAGGFGGF